MKSKRKTGDEKVVAALEGIRKLTEDLFILQASLAGVSVGDVRAMLGIDRSRVSRITKHVKKDR